MVRIVCLFSPPSVKTEISLVEKKKE